MIEPADPPAARWPHRATVVALCFAAIFLCYIDRVNISVAIIPMAKQFGWDKTLQGTVMSAFFVGYLLTQIAGGWLADRFGGKPVLAGGVVIWSLFTALTPPAAAGGFAALLVARIGMGIGEGVSFPSIYSLFSRWVPAHERSRAVGLVFSAIPLGTVFALIVTPWIVTAFGWPWAFYSFAALGILWAALWQPQVSSSPERSSRVGAAELRTIRAGAEASAPSTRPPLSALLGSSAVWAIVVCHFCNNWGGYVLLSWLPTYLNDRLGVDLASVGLFAMAPSIVSFLCLNAAGAAGDALLRRGMRTVTVRKLMQTIGFGAIAVALLVVPHVSSATLAIGVLCASAALGAAVAAGFGTNHLDIAPRHAGVVMGLSNTAGTLPGVIGVPLSGWIVEATGSWELVFQVAAGVKIFGLLFYLAYAKGEKIFD
jgi:ACS family sodium-dependent inorganic phosphate cotransporter